VTTIGDVEPFPADGVRLRGSWLEAPLRRAVDGAARLLGEPACLAVLDDFGPGSGRRLRVRLAAESVDPGGYVRRVLFYDGSNEAPCRRPRVHAFTVPGSRVVYACPSLGRLAATRSVEAEAIVIHEVLHTLGLPEDPPASADITAAVLRRCGPLRTALAEGDALSDSTPRAAASSRPRGQASAGASGSQRR
jgi:hypothetical protein